MKIKLLICDVDGTLTDNRATYTNDGNVSKTFSVLDGMGFGLLHQNGIEIAWITGSKEPCIKHRADHCGIKYFFDGIKEKQKVAERLIGELHLTWDNVAYIGDDINDLDCITKAGFTAVPNDAIIKECGVHHYTCQKNGGCGAVREFIEQIIKVSIHKSW